MWKFSFKSLLLVSTLLCGVFIGIQHAEHGILSMEGKDYEENKSFYIEKIDDDHVEVAALGETFSSLELEKKKELWDERNHHNSWSHVGNKMGEAIYTIASKGADWIMDQMD